MAFKRFPDILKQIEALPEAEQKAVYELFEALNPTYAFQKELLEYLFDLRARDEVPLEVIVNELQKRLSGIVKRESKWEIVRETLRKRRFPLLTKAESLFAQKVRQLELPDFVSIVPPEYWEDDNYVLKFNFHNAKEAADIISKLYDKSHLSLWQELFNEEWFEELFTTIGADR